MYDISIIVTVNKYEKNIKKLLNSINEQKLCKIELILAYYNLTAKHEKILKKLSSNQSNIKIIAGNDSLTYASLLKEINGNYFIFINPKTYFKIDKLKSAYDFSESNNLDILLFKKNNSNKKYNHDYFKNELSEGKLFNKKHTVDNLFEMPVPHLFKLYKKETVNSNNITLNKNLLSNDSLFFYETYLNSKCVSFKNISLSDESKIVKRDVNIINYANDLLDIFLNDEDSIYKNSVINETMNYLIENLDKQPIKSKQEYYKSIKNDFKGLYKFKELFKEYLTNKNLQYYNLLCENKYYLDFLSNYKLITTDYDILKNNTQRIETDYKISVIIPVYNTGNILHRTLHSIENQTFGIENIEIILVDDSSNDNTVNILNEYMEFDNYKIIKIKDRTGSPGTPRNIGLYESTSDYVMFLDHDDFFEINALEILYDTIKDYDCDLVYGTYVSVDRGYPTKITYPDEKQGFFSNIDENERSIAFPPPSIWTKLFKKELLIKNNILFTEFLGEDAIFMSKVLSKANGINYLGDTLICYHDLSNASTTNKITYDYLSSGLISEEYLYNFYLDIKKENYCNMRGENILDFYLIQFYKAELTEEEVKSIFPEIYQFANRFKKLCVVPNNPQNETLFEYIIQNDLDSIFMIKNIEVKKENKLKTYLDNIVNKLKR